MIMPPPMPSSPARKPAKVPSTSSRTMDVGSTVDSAGAGQALRPGTAHGHCPAASLLVSACQEAVAGVELRSARRTRPAGARRRCRPVRRRRSGTPADCRMPPSVPKLTRRGARQPQSGITACARWRLPRSSRPGVSSRASHLDGAFVRHRLRLRQQDLVAIVAHLADDGRRVHARQGADLEEELAFLGGDVLRGAAFDASDVQAGVRELEAVVALAGHQLLLQRVDEDDDLGRHLDRRHAEVAEGGMHRLAAHLDAIDGRALVRDHHLHQRRLADDRHRRLDRRAGEMRRQHGSCRACCSPRCRRARCAPACSGPRAGTSAPSPGSRRCRPSCRPSRGRRACRRAPSA